MWSRGRAVVYGDRGDNIVRCAVFCARCHYPILSASRTGAPSTHCAWFFRDASTSRGICAESVHGGWMWSQKRAVVYGDRGMISSDAGSVFAAHVRGCGGGTVSQHAGIRCLRSLFSAELRCAKAASVIAWCLRPPLTPSSAPRGAALHCLRRVRVMTTYLIGPR